MAQESAASSCLPAQAPLPARVDIQPTPGPITRLFPRTREQAQPELLPMTLFQWNLICIQTKFLWMNIFPRRRWKCMSHMASLWAWILGQFSHFSTSSHEYRFTLIRVLEPAFAGLLFCSLPHCHHQDHLPHFPETSVPFQCPNYNLPPPKATFFTLQKNDMRDPNLPEVLV